MHRKPFIQLLTVGMALMIAAPAAGESLRCRGSIISPGDRKYNVLATCGEPDYVESREIYTSRRVTRHRDSEHRYRRESFRIEVPIRIETWTYDLGPNRLIRYLHFEDEILVDITTGERGYW